MRLFAVSLFTLVLSACASSTPVVAPAPGPTPDPVVENTAIEIPDSGFWQKGDGGQWRYDLAVGFAPEVQLVAPGEGQGLMRVTLPPGATRAKVTALTVKYARNSVDSNPDPSHASGKAHWRLFTDKDGQPGEPIATLEVDVDGARATPLDYEFQDGDEEKLDTEGTRHAFTSPAAVPQTFWLVFERKSGDPRVGGMRLTEGNGLLGTFTDLFFRASPDKPIGPSIPIRPFIAIDFEGLR